jgi:hypothetical protein
MKGIQPDPYRAAHQNHDIAALVQRRLYSYDGPTGGDKAQSNKVRLN